MGFKDLRFLFKKENSVFLFLIILLIFAHSFTQFDLTWWLGGYMFMLLANTTLLYFILYIFLRDKLKRASFFLFPLCYLSSMMFWYFVTFSVFGEIVYYGLLLPICLYLWFIITAIFSMNGTYNKTKNWDGKFEKSSNSISSFIRWSLFIGGTIIANLLIYGIATYILFYMTTSPSISLEFIIVVLSYGMYIIIWVFFGIGVFFLFLKKKFLWLGTFIAFISFLAINIMIKAARIEYGSDSGAEFLPLQIIQYFYGLYLLLVSVASLISEKSKAIAQRIKIFNYEIILLWLIISMAIYNFGIFSFEYQTGDFWLELEVLSFLFPIIAGLFGIYGIVKYKKKQEKEIDLREI